MPLAILSAGRIAFNKAAVMAWAYREGRFAFRMCRNITERRQQLSNWLRKAWAAAKMEAAMLIDAARREFEARAHLAQRAREAVALAAQFRNDPEAIRFEIEREHYRQHFQPARIDALRGALASIGA
ncbi:conserved hypothetical protein [Hyphomicrobiales bacterium]|nr:conserved hypothetical protein [Hyphomicrobiales bacterium]CAH1697272.1 conserved hypothetical protein [Hyphomicrobiales bacterium]CAI0342839.1 conserved hypothetical protein [Hyphomicrobiales bacterium]